MFAVVTLVHLADSKEELDSDTETLQSIARKHLCQLTTLNWQQADGLVTALPLGLRRIDALRTLTTEALAVLMPFKAQEIWDRGGVYYGQNAISKNLIVADRRQLLNGNAFILGVSGSGKSFSAKKEMVSLALSTQDDIIVIDPESEYRPLIEGLGGQVINISATSPNHINAMDMEQGYGDGENPVVLKSEFLLSLCEELIGAGKLSAKEKSVIDRCTAQVYRDYIRSGYHGAVPTLQDFHAELLRQPEKEAQDVALAIELFTDGSLNTFAKPTNVDTNARILCYDIRDLGKQLLPVGMLVVLDSIFNRIIRNRGLKRNTWIYIDEIYLLFQHEYSANFLFTLWKRISAHRQRHRSQWQRNRSGRDSRYSWRNAGAKPPDGRQNKKEPYRAARSRRRKPCVQMGAAAPCPTGNVQRRLLTSKNGLKPACPNRRGRTACRWNVTSSPLHRIPGRWLIQQRLWSPHRSRRPCCKAAPAPHGK